MSYAICSYVLTFGGVPKIIFNVISGQSVSRVVLSVRECSLWGIMRGMIEGVGFALISV